MLFPLAEEASAFEPSKGCVSTRGFERIFKNGTFFFRSFWLLQMGMLCIGANVNVRRLIILIMCA